MAERVYPTRRNDDLARAVIGLIASRNGESMDFNGVQSKLDIRSRPDLLDCLLQYPQIFLVSHERGRSEVVRLIVPVSLCPDYCSESNCHNRDCQMFHICKFYILSDGCLSKRNSCKYGHKLDSYHNNQLYRGMLLDDLSFRNLQKLFRLPRNRTEASIPRICSFYNVRAGCSKRGKCTSLHICEHHVWGNCKFGRSKCNRSHDILDNEKILNRFGINTARDQLSILAEIKAMYDMIEERNRQNAGYINHTMHPRDSFHSSLDKYTPRSKNPDIFKMTTMSQHLEEQHSNGEARSVAYPVLQPQPQPPTQRSRHRYHSAGSGPRDDMGSSRHMRSISQQPVNRKLYSPSRRFGSSANISSRSNEPVICQYYMDGYCRYKNHCKNIHPPKHDQDVSDSGSEDYYDRSYTSEDSDY